MVDFQNEDGCAPGITLSRKNQGVSYNSPNKAQCKSPDLDLKLFADYPL